eukprot:CAMPEP_0171568922 /NCGR_PEP_ID=MMETSP0961-20121227/2050_1 /TAXON_ID=87120 /ORGANISM="Aurantiochytrium limacinum, Strain ATCCMYA-1381" /LENGTH=407 /DNA_ID=CAMNT_0012123139 /DNA_START=15 /DNA_END=1238 /DNA_ORIENTATION=-
MAPKFRRTAVKRTKEDALAATNASKIGGVNKGNSSATGKAEETKNSDSIWSHDFPRFIRNSVIICVVVVGPYAIYSAYMWIMLSSGLVRPVVRLEDPRQMLVIGTQSSGTMHTAESLNDLGIEVAHETADSENHFARDGTVGWAQGIWFLSNKSERDSRLNIAALCTKPLLRIMHSTQFEPSSECSYRVQWDQCWKAECEDVFTRHFGCYPHCTHPPGFGRVMLQVRHPINTVASLVVKYCTDAKPGTLPHPLKMATLDGIMADMNWQDMRGGCKEVFGWYWVEYNRRVLAAFNNEVSPSFTWFRVEDTSACEVAKLAGFLSPIPGGNDLTYGPTRDNARKACTGKVELISDSDSAQHAKPAKIRSHGDVNRGNKGYLNLTWSDFDDLPDLKEAMSELAGSFGYPIA